MTVVTWPIVGDGLPQLGDSVDRSIVYRYTVMTWTKQKPSKPGWYWLLDPSEEPGLPTIVQVFFDWESGRSLAIIPASTPKASVRLQDLRGFAAMWAGRIEIPVVFASVA